MFSTVAARTSLRQFRPLQSLTNNSPSRTTTSPWIHHQLKRSTSQHFPPARLFSSRVYPVKMPAEKPKIVFVLGGPGAGKGTQCSKIVERFNFVHLSAGDLLREERARKGSEVGALIEDYIRNGKIVPVEVTCSLLENAINKSDSDKFLIDGFPRNQDNLDGWTRQMSEKIDFRFVLFFNCSEDVCVERCLSRGQSGSGRSDDNMESLKKRIQTYTNDSLPIIKHFEQLGQVKKIDASPSAAEVFESVEKVFLESGFQ